MADEVAAFPRRIYPLDPKELTEEQMAVVFAMTSRRPEPFDEIARMVTEEKAADFHERWVLGYGHASVAEHAILHMAVENISRLACDTLEDNRLASYTEKSSRYQVLPNGYYYTPPELAEHPKLLALYTRTCDSLFETYDLLLKGTQEHLREIRPQREDERDGAYNLRLRREATDVCRFILPAATLTNVGVTMNARTMEHAIRKLLSADLQEEREIGELLKQEGRRITPTLIKYAEPSPFLTETREAARKLQLDGEHSAPEGNSRVHLLYYDPDAEAKVVAAFLYAFSQEPFPIVWQRVTAMSAEERLGVLEEALGRLGPFDAPGREMELPRYLFEFVMDYGAYREFKRHRMQSYLPQPLTTAHGYTMPPLLEEAGLATPFQEAMVAAAQGYSEIAATRPLLAQYLVTHAHHRRVLAQINLRECYNLFKLRTGPQAHFTLREVMNKALTLCREVHPTLFHYLQRRDR